MESQGELLKPFQWYSLPKCADHELESPPNILRGKFALRDRQHFTPWQKVWSMPQQIGGSIILDRWCDSRNFLKSTL